MQLHELPVFSPRNQRLKKMRGFLRKVRSACLDHKDWCPDRTPEDWCNLAHIHLDWHNYGAYSRRARSLFMQGYAYRFDLFAKMFMRQKLDFQLWIMVHPYDSGADCLYYHTPNPHSDFPTKLYDTEFSISAEHMFTELLPQYEMIEWQSGDKRSLAYYAKGVGFPLS